MCKISVIGLGYVGLPLARLFSTKYNVVGFDINVGRVSELSNGHDSTSSVDDTLLQEAIKTNLVLSSDEKSLKGRDFYIVAVPTPIDDKNNPDLGPVISATKLVGRAISKGATVVFESTVAPGTTEEVCKPILESVSGLICNKDFFLGYSPERINPGDMVHTLENTVKITSGSTPEAAKNIDNLYSSVLENGTYMASSLKVAEAAKIIENCQRDVNIAFANEINRIFMSMGIDARDVLAAAGTKWNFVHVAPGMVGGHCIGVDPYYLIEKSISCGVEPALLKTARSVNSSVPDFVVKKTTDLLQQRGFKLENVKVLLLGFAFKEDCPDSRNTRVADIYNELKPLVGEIVVHDDLVDPNKVKKEYNIEVTSESTDNFISQFDAVILCVAHSHYAHIDARSFLRTPDGVISDVKGVLDRNTVDLRL